MEYDACNRIAKQKEGVGEGYEKYETTYAYDIENKPTEINLGGDASKVTNAYDKLGRLRSQTMKSGQQEFTFDLEYQAGGYGNGSTTQTVEKIAQPGHAYEYTYRGGLTAERHNSTKTSYEYDALGQLKRVNDAGRQKSTAYEYDQGGNLLRKTEHAYATRGRMLGEAERTIEYAYGDAGWKDLLTAYDGVPIESDEIGNVVNDGSWCYTWRLGRQLEKMESAGETLRYTYDASGNRIRKESSSGGLTEYTLSGNRVVHLTHNATSMHFWYGTSNTPVMVTFNGRKYSYVHNLQGDVIALLDMEDGFAEVVTYAYDAWGKPIGCTGTMAETLGRMNPFRYRGYVYDEETGLYYLRSRYYNPEWGRFISADSLLGDRGKLLAHNLFAYCGNNPVIRSDPDGYEYNPEDGSWAQYYSSLSNEQKNTVQKNGGTSTSPPPKNNPPAGGTSSGSSQSGGGSSSSSSEHVIIVGGAFNDRDNDTKYNFVASGFSQADYLIYRGVSPSNITMVIANTGFTEEEMKTFTAKGREMGISVVSADSKEEVLNYLNYGDVTGQTDLREGDGQKIASAYVYSHGLGYYRSPSKPPVNSVALAYGGGAYPMSWQITAKDILGLKKSAFLPDSVTVFYSCNAGTRSDDHMAITAAWAQATGGHAFGVGDIEQKSDNAGGQVTYEYIGGLKDLMAATLPMKGTAFENTAFSAWYHDMPDGSTNRFDPLANEFVEVLPVMVQLFDNLMR